MRRWLGRNLFVGVRQPRPEMVRLVARRDLRESISDTRLFIASTSLTFVIPLLASGGVALADHYLGQGGRGITERLVEVGAFFVVFLPASFSLVLALESFSGERERNTLETLFATRLRESEIYLGKILAVIIPSLTLSYSALVVYTMVAWFVVGLFPAALVAPLVVVTLAQALVMVSGATIVSSQTKTLRSANVMASFIIIPMSGVIQGESILIISHLEWILWAVAAMLGVVALLLLRLGMVGFNRETILAKESRPPDRGGWVRRRTWRPAPGAVAGGARGLPREVLGAYRRSRTAIVVAASLLAGGVVLGIFAQRLALLPAKPVAALVNAQASGGELVTGTPSFFTFILGHNLLVAVVMVAFAPLTLGVAGGLLMVVNGFVIGYIGAQYATYSVHYPTHTSNGLTVFFCGIAPHGILEIPALVFAYAFALRVGASMVRPSPEGWLRGMRTAVADYGRGAVLFVAMFVAAAAIEAFITPGILDGC